MNKRTMITLAAIAATAIVATGCPKPETPTYEGPTHEEMLQEQINDLHHRDTELLRYGPLLDCMGIERQLPDSYERWVGYVVVNPNGFLEEQRPVPGADTPYVRIELPYSQARDGYHTCQSKDPLNMSPEEYNQMVEDLLSGKLSPGDY